MRRAAIAVVVGATAGLLGAANGCSSTSSPGEHTATFEAGTFVGDDASESNDAGDIGTTIDAPAKETSVSEDAGPLPFTCASMCQEAFGACSSAQLGWGTQPICASECAALPMGTLGDTTDSLGCRLAQAELAQADASTHCLAAGASGSATCGSRCDAFCTLVFAICVQANRDAGNPYASMGDCTTACNAFAIEDGGPEYDPTASNTLNCRQYHLQQAWSDPVGGSAFDECPNLAKVGGVCN